MCRFCMHRERGRGGRGGDYFFNFLEFHFWSFCLMAAGGKGCEKGRKEALATLEGIIYRDKKWETKGLE